MKRLALLAAAAMTLLSVFSCSKEEPKEDILTMNSTTYTVSNAGAEQTIAFTATADWTISSDAEWITLDKTSGVAGAATVKMTIAPNTDYSERNGKVILTMADKQSVFNVKQTELKGFASAMNMTIDASEQDVAVDVNSNLEYTVAVEEAAQNWISITQTKAAPVEGKIILHVAANTGIGPRTGSFTVSTSECSQTYTITQSAEYTPAQSASALYLRNRQNIYDNENWAYTTFGQFAVILETETGEKVTLVLNNARTDADGKELGIGKALIAGTYEVDATAVNADKTFSIKSTNGKEKYYTTIAEGEREIAVIDGEINVEAAEDGTYTITATLMDAAEALHRYSYQGKIEVADDSFGALCYDNPAFYNTYYTYFTTKANQWNVTLYVSEDGKADDEYVRYITLTLYGPAGDNDGKNLPDGTFKLEEPSSDATLSYACGTTIANPMTFTVSAYTADGNPAKVDFSKGGSVVVTKYADGTYDFDLKASFIGTKYDDETWSYVETGKTFNYAKTLSKVYVPEGNVTMIPYPDGDAVAKTVFTSQYVGLWFGDAMGNGGNCFVIGFSGSAVNNNYEIYLALNIDGEWEYVKNFNNRYCNSPLPYGKYEFSAEGAKGSIIPVKYGTNVYCYVKNTYTGTKMSICGGSITLTASTITYDLKVKAGTETYSFTGSHDATLYYHRDMSKNKSYLKLYTVE